MTNKEGEIRYCPECGARVRMTKAQQALPNATCPKCKKLVGFQESRSNPPSVSELDMSPDWLEREAEEKADAKKAKERSAMAAAAARARLQESVAVPESNSGYVAEDSTDNAWEDYPGTPELPWLSAIAAMLRVIAVILGLVAFGLLAMSGRNEAALLVTGVPILASAAAGLLCAAAAEVLHILKRVHDCQCRMTHFSRTQTNLMRAQMYRSNARKFD